MSCPGLVELERFATRDIDDDSRRALEIHVAECPMCQGRLGEVQANLQALEPIRRVLVQSHSSGRGVQSAAPPQEIAGMRILRELRRDASGVVYAAQEQMSERKVALKLLYRSGGDDPYRDRILQRDVRALTRLRHVGIAAFHDAGRTPGRHAYLTMELVEGQPITEFVRERKAALRDRVALLVAVVDAVAYGHQRGVLHRRLNPANILVAVTGGPKVLDFGLMNALCDDAASGLGVAADTACAPPSAAYISPEEARGEPADDVRSDTYSLGVIMFETLTEQLPYTVDASRWAETARTICEQPPMSMRKVNPAIPRDLEAIVLKTLEKDASRRYASAAALRDDLARYLANQPVLVRSESLAYQLRKLASLHPVMFVSIAVVFAISIGASVWMSALYADSQRQRTELLLSTYDVHASLTRAQSDLATARATEHLLQSEVRVARDEIRIAELGREYLVDAFDGTDPESDSEFRDARAILSQARQRLDAEASQSPEARAEALTVLGRAMRGLWMLADSQTALIEAVAIRSSTSGEHGSEAARVRIELAHTISLAQNHADAETLLRAAIADLASNAAVNERELIHARNLLATTLRQSGNLAEAEQISTTVIAALSEKASPHPCELADAQTNVAQIAHSRGAYARAEEAYRAALDNYKQALGDRHPQVATTLRELAALQVAQKRPADAESVLREALAILEAAPAGRAAQRIAARSDLGACLANLERASDAEPLLIEAYDAAARQLRENSEIRRRARERLIEFYTKLGRTDDAKRYQD